MHMQPPLVTPELHSSMRFQALNTVLKAMGDQGPQGLQVHQRVCTSLRVSTVVVSVERTDWQGGSAHGPQDTITVQLCS